MPAHLYSGRGEYVASVEIPPFETGFPPIVVWGVRTFRRVVWAGGEGSYIETFAYVARTTSDRRPRYLQRGEPVPPMGEDGIGDDEPPARIATRDDVKDVYAEGINVGIALGRKLGPREDGDDDEGGAF